MKATVSCPEDQLFNKETSAICGINFVKNDSKLKVEDYKKLLVSHFVNHIKIENLGINEDEYMYRDGYVISTVKQSLSSIRFIAECFKTKLSGYEVAFIRDKNGYSFELIVFPEEEQTNRDVIDDVKNSLHEYFYTETSEEEYKVNFKLIPHIGIQTELMKAGGVPMFALRLGLELNLENSKFEINFYSDESSRIDSLGNYREI